MFHGLNRLLVGATSFLLLCTGAQALAHDVDELSRQADQAYADGEYVRSGELYESAIELGAREIACRIQQCLCVLPGWPDR